MAHEVKDRVAQTLLTLAPDLGQGAAMTEVRRRPPRGAQISLWGQRYHPVVRRVGEVHGSGVVHRHTCRRIEVSERQHRLTVRSRRQLHRPVVVSVGDIDGSCAAHRDSVRRIEVSERQHRLTVRACRQFHHPVVVAVRDVDGSGVVRRGTGRLPEIGERRSISASAPTPFFTSTMSSSASRSMRRDRSRRATTSSACWFSCW